MTSLDQQLFETLMPSQPMGNGFEDFFDFDMLLASSSRSSSRSPAHSPAFPPTPPQPTADADASLYGFGLFDEYAKPANPLAAFPPAQPYDFSAILGAGAVTGSPASSSATAVSPSLAIDPQLVDSPSPPQDEEDHDDDQDDEEEPEPLKVGGKGKHRKGTVQSGGVQKKVKVVEKKELEDADDWRPSPEEYKKMSSKEKRQLRNKISARNFRNRRKEYINTLEGDIADRDRLIDAIRNELGSTKSENVALREEIDALKKALLQGREGPVLPPPGPLPEIPAAITAATVTPKPSTPLISPNLHKDMPSSSRNAARAFRPGNNNSFSNFMPVHTTLIPEFPSIFANTQHISAADLAGKHTEPAEIAVPSLQENMNPALNSLPPHHGQTPMSGVHAFDAFADVNPFTLKTLDAYRMQLWGRMALAQQQQRRQQWQTQTQAQTPQTQGSPLPGGLASELRPAFFTSSAKANVSTAVLAGKAAAASAPAPLPGTLAAAQAQHNAQVDMAAAMVGQSMLQRLGGAFWDAFAGTDKKAGSVDTDKLRRVLEGKAVVRVVDVDEPAPKASVRPTMVPQQSVRPQQMQRSPSAPSPKMSPRLGPSVSSCPSSVVTDILEESMRALTISKKSPPV